MVPDYRGTTVIIIMSVYFEVHHVLSTIALYPNNACNPDSKLLLTGSHLPPTSCYLALPCTNQTTWLMSKPLPNVRMVAATAKAAQCEHCQSCYSSIRTRARAHTYTHTHIHTHTHGHTHTYTHTPTCMSRQLQHPSYNIYVCIHLSLDTCVVHRELRAVPVLLSGHACWEFTQRR